MPGTRLLPYCAVFLMIGSLSASAADNVHFRGSLENARIRFEREGVGHVAFIGGSITQMNGYRPMVCEILEERFPETEFEFTQAGISSTCSTTGAMRLETDVLSKGPVDLFFIEFAVNDDQDAHHAHRECLRGMEGIVRQCLSHNPNMDIVITYFVNTGMLELLQGAKTPVSIAAHSKVAQHYSLSTIHLAQEVADRIANETLTWKIYGGVHPKPAGNRICADMIDRLFDKAWSKQLDADAMPVAHQIPTTPLDSGSYSDGRFIGVETARPDTNWQLGVPDWESLPGSKRKQYIELEFLHSDKAGAELTLDFSGRAVGIFLLAGPDAGTLQVQVDDGVVREHDLYHFYSRSLHYPRSVIFESNLEPGPHRLKLKVASGKNSASQGHAVRIMRFVAN